MPLFPIHTKTGHGFIDREGRVVVEPTLKLLAPAFAYPAQFRNGLAAVKTPTRPAYIDRKGSIVWSEK